ncbi:hypothetical protein CP8484711_1199A, partial [Chlamydia psittaci 84-8471/1]
MLVLNDSLIELNKILHFLQLVLKALFRTFVLS